MAVSFPSTCRFVEILNESCGSSKYSLSQLACRNKKKTRGGKQQAVAHHQVKLLEFPIYSIRFTSLQTCNLDLPNFALRFVRHTIVFF